MKHDLTGIFQQGLMDTENWTKERVHEALQSIALQSPGSFVDWEPGDEEWGRVIEPNGDVMSILCARVPVGVIRSAAVSLKQLQHIAWVHCESLREPSYQVSRDVLKAIFNRELSPHVDYSAMSINDLWWATNS